LALSVPHEGYLRNVSYVLNVISTFVLDCPTKMTVVSQNRGFFNCSLLFCIKS